MFPLKSNKKEVYLNFIVEGGLYLPPIMDSNKHYLKAITTGVKTFYFNIYQDVKVIKLAQLKSHSIKRY